MAFYVSAIRGQRRKLLVGPFRRHGDALAHVDRMARWLDGRFSDTQFPDYGVGTARHRTSHAPGALNADYGIVVDEAGWCGRDTSKANPQQRTSNQ